MRAKDRHKKLMMEHWSNPANAFCSRIDMHNKVLGITQTTFYKHFTPDELTEIENEAAIERRKRYARERSVIVDSLYEKGAGGDVPAAKEFLDRTEGKILEKKQVDANLNIVIKDTFSADTDPV